jgi:hypothetical protein
VYCRKIQDNAERSQSKREKGIIKLSASDFAESLCEKEGEESREQKSERDENVSENFGQQYR